jgi:hypothetical protein
MIFDFYNQFGALNSSNVFKKFEQGLQKHGHQVQHHTGKGDVAVIWSVLWFGRMRRNQEVFDTYRSQGKSVIVLEIGNLVRDKTPNGVDPNATWKVGINGINRNSYFNSSGNDSSRAERLGLKLKPWKSGGDHILICSQHERSEQWRTMPSSDIWVSDMITKIREHSDRPIRIRPHPRFPLRRNFNQNSVLSHVPFQTDLNTAWSVVNHCSNPGIEAVIEGVPAFVHDISLAAPVANTDYSMMEKPLRPDRTQWLNDLAWTEWTQQEMLEGIPQDLIFKKLM